MRTRLPLRAFVLLATSSAILAAGAGGAGAATVVNGDFETGTLSGWTEQSAPPPGEMFSAGGWFAYTGTTSPFEPELAPTVPPPPAGNFAAIVAQGGPGQRILYQDVALEPYYSHQFSMLVYYRSQEPLITPSPNTLGYEGADNQQYRVDVIKPTASLDTLDPADILATVFATSTGSPQTLAATTYSADLTTFAGQTVRIRLAEVDNEGVLNAGADSVAIQSTPPSNSIKIGKKKLNKKKGSAKVSITVPGAGLLTAKKKGSIKPVTKTITAAATLKIALKPTSSALKKLNKKGKLKIKVPVTFTPTGGLPATTKVKVTLKKDL